MLDRIGFGCELVCPSGVRVRMKRWMDLRKKNCWDGAPSPSLSISAISIPGQFIVSFYSESTVSLSHTRPKSASIQQEQCQPCMTTYIHHKHTMVVVSTSSMSLYYGSLLSTSRPLLGYSTVWRPCPEILFEPFQCTFPYPIIRNVCE